MNRLLIIAVMLFLFGCSKDETPKPIPVIVINTPMENQHFVMGDTIHITGTITHSIPLAEIGIHMTDLTSKVEFFHEHHSVSNISTYNFDTKFVIPSNAKTSFKVEIEAMDTETTEVTKEITITVN